MRVFVGKKNSCVSVACVKAHTVTKFFIKFLKLDVFKEYRHLIQKLVLVNDSGCLMLGCIKVTRRSHLFPVRSHLQLLIEEEVVA